MCLMAQLRMIGFRANEKCHCLRTFFTFTGRKDGGGKRRENGEYYFLHWCLKPIIYYVSKGVTIRIPGGGPGSFQGDSFFLFPAVDCLHYFFPIPIYQIFIFFIQAKAVKFVNSILLSDSL